MGIGDRGKTLKEMLKESRELFQEKGCYGGINVLELKEKDPIKYELLHSRLLATLIGARETTRMIASSPIAREVAELCCALYTPEGDCIAQSTGIQVHTVPMGEVIQWMIEHDYEEEVGIREGDIFTCNDNAIAGMHPADVYDIVPIFFEGELVSWAATVIMEPEIGAVSPGGMPVANTERYSDGFRVCAEKTGVNDQLRKDFEYRVKFQLRMADMFLLDRKGALAANVRIREEVKRIIQEFGLDYYKRAIRELIEDERRGQLYRARTRTIPGRYRNSLCQEFYMARLPVLPYASKDQIVLIPLEFTIEPSGKFTINCDGAGSWGFHSMNASASGMYGGLSISLVQTMAYDGKANCGTLLATEVKTPPNTIVNPGNIFIPTASIWCVVINFYGLWLSCISRAYFARGFREEILLCGGSTNIIEMSGTDHFGKFPFGFIGFECAGTHGSGARGIMDGIDAGYDIWNTEADLGSFEVWELVFPELCIARNFIPDSCGFGRYRAGYSICTTWLLYKTPSIIFDTIPITCHEKIGLNSSIFGGYPGPIWYTYYLKDSNIKEVINQRGPLPHEEGDRREPNLKKMLQGKFVALPSLAISEELKDGDIIQIPYSPGSGGLGDPLERDFSLIKQDLNNGLTYPKTAREIYGIEADYDKQTKEWVIKEEESQLLRQKKRKERLARAIPVEQWWRNTREMLLQKQLEPLLQAMYNDSLNKGEKWSQEFREFWDLPEDFSF